MVPLGPLVTVTETLGPQVITRYNLYPSASVNGVAAAYPAGRHGDHELLPSRIAPSRFLASPGPRGAGEPSA